MGQLNLVNKVKFFNRYLKLVQNPTDLGAVISLNNTLHKMIEPEHINEILEAFNNSETGRNSLIQRPRIGKTDFKYLSGLPENTLGRTYYEFLTANQLDPNDLPVHDPQNNKSEYEFARAHIFECHDIWHVLTGFNTEVDGELGLQAFYLTQFPSRMSLILFSSGFLYEAEMPIENSRQTLEAMIHGYNLGKKAHGFLGRDWKADWEKDLIGLRAELGIE